MRVNKRYRGGSHVYSLISLFRSTRKKTDFLDGGNGEVSLLPNKVNSRLPGKRERTTHDYAINNLDCRKTKNDGGIFL